MLRFSCRDRANSCLLYRVISYNFVNFKNPGHSAPLGLTPPLSLTEAFQATGGPENAPEDDFCRPGNVQSATTPPDRQNLPIYGYSIWLFYQFLVICVTFSPTECGSVGVFIEFPVKTRFYRLPLVVACENFCSLPGSYLELRCDLPCSTPFS